MIAIKSLKFFKKEHGEFFGLAFIKSGVGRNSERITRSLLRG